MPIFENARYLHWVLAHLDEIRPALELADKLIRAPDVERRWEYMKQLGDILVAVIDDFPLDPVPAELSLKHMSAMQAHIEAQGIDWNHLIELLPLVLTMVQLIVEEFE